MLFYRENSFTYLCTFDYIIQKKIFQILRMEIKVGLHIAYVIYTT